MGIVAAKLALAWFHMLLLPDLALAHLSGAVSSGATQSSGFRLVRRHGIVYLLHSNVPAKAALAPKETKVPSETTSPPKIVRTNLFIIDKTLAP